MAKRSCPTPNKAGYPTREAAERALRNAGKMTSFYTPHRCYPCRCKKWHLSSKPKVQHGARR